MFGKINIPRFNSNNFLISDIQFYWVKDYRENRTCIVKDELKAFVSLISLKRLGLISDASNTHFKLDSFISAPFVTYLSATMQIDNTSGYPIIFRHNAARFESYFQNILKQLWTALVQWEGYYTSVLHLSTIFRASVTVAKCRDASGRPPLP